MIGISSRLTVLAGALAMLAGTALAAQDKYEVKVPGGLALGECRGYDDWAAVSVSNPQEPEEKINLIVGNPTMMAAYRAGIPENGKPFPDGSKTVKILYHPKKNTIAPFPVQVPDTIAGLGCMVKDSKRFADSGGWGYAQFDYDAATGTFSPNTSQQGNNAKCGAACHVRAKARDDIFTEYGTR